MARALLVRGGAPRRTPQPGDPTIIELGEFLDTARGPLARLAAATAVGAIIGIDRDLRGKPAGLRTHALVSLGAAVVTLSALELSRRDDGVVDGNVVTRAVQGIIAGVGLLGGGVILKSGPRGNVRNLTTAASIWVVACIGVVCGAGQWMLAAATLTLTLLVLTLGGPVERALQRLLGRWGDARRHDASGAEWARRQRRTARGPDADDTKRAADSDDD